MRSWRFWLSPGALPLWGALLLAAWAGLNAAANRELGRELDRIKAAGDPLVPAEYAKPAVPDVDNAALGVLRALALFKEESGDSSERERFLADWAAATELAPRMESWIAANAHALAELRRASALPASRYPFDYAKGILADTPSLGAALRCVELLGASARLALARGDAAECDRLLAAALRLGLDWSDEPYQFVSTPGAGLFKKASALWQAALNAGHAPGPASRKVIGAPRPEHFTLNLRRSLRFDRSGILAWFLSTSNPWSGTEVEGSLFATPVGRPFVKRELVNISGAFQAAIDFLGPPETRPSTELRLPPEGWLTMVLLPDFGRIASFATEGNIALDFARAALAALDADGAWPPPETAFAGLIDRFTGKPVTFARAGDRLVLVSVGRDRAPDGGDPSKDVVFRLPARRPR